MTRLTGMGSQLWIGGNDLGADTNSIGSISGGPAPLEFTDITQLAHERKGGERDGHMDITSYWNPTRAHPVYAAMPTADVIATWAAANTIGYPAANLPAKQLNYDGNRGNDGGFLLNVQMLGNAYGLQWSLLATAGRRVDTAATGAGSVSPLDQGSASPGAFGGVMWVHLFAFTGTSVTIKLQSSSDNGADAYADVPGATTVALTTAPAAYRIAVTGDIERYLKVVTIGTFTSADFSVSFARHRTQVDY